MGGRNFPARRMDEIEQVFLAFVEHQVNMFN
jgi:hypothetical protein